MIIRWMVVDGIRSELRAREDGDRSIYQRKIFSLKADVEAHLAEPCPYCTDSDEIIVVE